MTTSGLLLVDKPGGLTSHDVVARVRRIVRERRVGHAGTLDPMATGLLVVAVGPSTRLLRFAQAEVKRYTGTLRLGVATDSLDADGAVVEERVVRDIDAVEVSEAAVSMTGPQLQTPPMVSALKVDGRRLHELARAGIEVERAPRHITVERFDVTATTDPLQWDFDVTCSVGTYVRVLASDLAQRLGTVGHLVALRRVRSGAHRVEDALTLEAIEDAYANGTAVLRPPIEFVEGLTSVTLDDAQVARMRQGQRLDLDVEASSNEVAAIDGAGVLVGVLGRRATFWQPELVLAEEPAGRG